MNDVDAVKGVQIRGCGEWIGKGKSGILGSISGHYHKQEENNCAEAIATKDAGLCWRKRT